MPRRDLPYCPRRGGQSVTVGKAERGSDNAHSARYANRHTAILFPIVRERVGVEPSGRFAVREDDVERGVRILLPMAGTLRVELLAHERCLSAASTQSPICELVGPRTPYTDSRSAS